MPEIKHSFTTGKMNKDLDERLVRPGEYRDALNIQVRTTDGGDSGVGDAGAAQNLEGNYRIGSTLGDYTGENDENNVPIWGVYDGALPQISIASIADEKNDKAYFFFACKESVPQQAEEIVAITERKTFVDSIIEQDVNLATVPVIVDVYAIADTALGIGITGGNDNLNFGYLYSSSGGILGEENPYYGIQGLTVKINQVKANSIFKVYNLDGQQVMAAKILSVSGTDNNVTLRFYDEQVINFNDLFSSFVVIEDEKRTLSFNPNKKVSAINIIDDLLFWTDGATEPKRINIKTCKAGTSDYDSHTINIYVNEATGENSNPINTSIGSINAAFYGLDSYIREQNITVIKRAPKTPPTLHIDQVIPNTINIQTFFNFINTTGAVEEYEEGDVITIEDNGFLSSGNIYVTNDFLIFKSEDTDGQDFENKLIVRCKFISYLNDEDNLSLEPTNKIQVEILRIEGDEPEINGDDEFSALEIQGGVNFSLSPDDDTVFPLFELKFPRFGYRYRYQDGEYSSFSPFSEVAFFPQDFDYSVKKGYNLGMRNKIKRLTIKDFIPLITDRGQDVEAVDILYKTTDNANVYVVKTIERDIDVEWENYTPSSDNYNSGNRMTGEITITSEMIHTVLPSNQILRAWDNVPRFATAQEITGNRLLYGNYTQGYKLNKKVELIQEIKSESTASTSNPQPSIKTLRNYKLGMVFGDIYGRETPVIESGLTIGEQDNSDSPTLTGDIIVDKSLCALANRFVLTQMWRNGDPLSWMDYVKYYVKETTNEYYNLVMDRWYYAEDKDNMWISFPSADRNKIDDETYLILKNKHGSNEAVLEPARYRVIAIENEAPDFIKIDYRTLGRIPMTTAETGHDSETPNASDDPENLLGQKEIELVNYNSFLDNYDLRGELYWRIVAELDNTGDGITNAEFYSGEYQVLNHWRVVTDGAAENNGWNAIFNWEETTGDETNLRQKVEDDPLYNSVFDPGTGAFTPANGYLKYYFELQERVVQNRPEFDGRFFVLIEKDDIIEEYVETLTGVSVEYAVEQSWDIGYIDTQPDNPAIQGPFQNYYWGQDDTTSNDSVITSAGGTVFANFAGSSNQPFQNDLDQGNTDMEVNTPGQDTGNNSWVGYFALGCSDGGNNGFLSTGSLTRYYWRGFLNSRKNISGGTGDTTNTRQGASRVFIDAARSARFKWDDNDGNPANDSLYPSNANHFKPPGLDFGNAANGTYGRMWLSQTINDDNAGGNWQGVDSEVDGVDPDDENPGNLNELAQFCVPGAFFRFEADPTVHYKITSVYSGGSAVSGGKTKNYKYGESNTAELFSDNSIYNLFSDIEVSIEDNQQGCDDCDNTDYNCFRHTKIIDFVRLDQFGNETNEGINVNLFDPRGNVRHDGQGTIVIQQLKQVINSGGIDVPEDNRGIWETEPKEGPDLELYYEASHAIPMNVRLGNANSFSPIESKILVERKSFNNVIVEQNLNASDINFGEDTFENVRLKDIFYNETNPIVQIKSTDVSNGNIINHDHNIGIGDTIKFVHNNGTITSSKVLSHQRDANPLAAISNAPILVPQEQFEMTISWPNDETQDLINGSEDGVDFNTSSPSVSTGANIIGDGVPSGVFLYNFGEGNIRISDFSWMTENEEYDVIAIQPTGYYEIDGQVWKYPIKLAWHNCWSFGNGLESDRVRDDYNAPQMDNGVKVSTTLAGYKVEEIGSGMIYSGIYNSISSTNNLNEFNMAEKITKTLNPSYGSIQALKTRDTDVVTLCEDKILKVLSNKDAVFNADGNTGLTATDRVLGTAIPFVGDYGISKNPESLASDQYRMYFTDKQRGAVMRLSRDGLTPISNVGMQTWFRENLRKADTALGTFDKVNGEYNLTLENTETNYSNTISFNEASKGWVSFKSFVPESGTSVSGRYLTSKEGLIYQHYWKEYEDNGYYNDDVYINGDCTPFEDVPLEYQQCKERNNFYGVQYDSKISVLFNDSPGSVKSFKTLNYEGSQARIVKYTESTVSDDFGNILDNLTDGQYYNLMSKNGWYVESFTTDLQTGNIPEFKNKENKWFNRIYGETTDFNNLDTKEFSVQGIGVISGLSSDSIDTGGDDPVVDTPPGCVDSIFPYVNGVMSSTVNEGQVVTIVIETENFEDGSLLYLHITNTNATPLSNNNSTGTEPGPEYFAPWSGNTYNITPEPGITGYAGQVIGGFMDVGPMPGQFANTDTISTNDIIVAASTNPGAPQYQYQGTEGEFDWINNDVISQQDTTGLSPADYLNGVDPTGFENWTPIITENPINGSPLHQPFVVEVVNNLAYLPIYVNADIIDEIDEAFIITAAPTPEQEANGFTPVDLRCQALNYFTEEPMTTVVKIVNEDVEILPVPTYLSLTTVDNPVSGVGNEITQINEGGNFYVKLETANVPDGTQIGFSLIFPDNNIFASPEDLTNVDVDSSVQNAGAVLTITNNQATFNVEVAADDLLEGTEYLMMTLTNLNNSVDADGVDILVADTDFAQTITVDETIIQDSAGNSLTAIGTSIQIIDSEPEEEPQNVQVFPTLSVSAAGTGITSGQVDYGVDQVGQSVLDGTFNVGNTNSYLTGIFDQQIYTPAEGFLINASDFTIGESEGFTIGLNVMGGQGDSIVFDDIQGQGGDYIDQIILSNTGDPSSANNTLSVLFKYREDFVVPEINDENTFNGTIGYTDASNDSAFDSFFFISAGTLNGETTPIPPTINPIIINVGLQTVSGSFINEASTAVQAVGGQVNQIFSDNDGNVCNENSGGGDYFDEMVTNDAGVTSFALDGLSPSSSQSDLDNYNTWPCRSVRLAVPNGATVANGGLPDKIKFRVRVQGGGETIEGDEFLYGISPENILFPQNTTAQGGTENPYAISDMSIYANDTIENVSGAMVVNATNVEFSQVMNTIVEVSIPVEPNFTAPQGTGVINVLVPMNVFPSQNISEDNDNNGDTGFVPGFSTPGG